MLSSRQPESDFTNESADAPEWTDAECLVGVAQGQHPCFAELLTRYQSRVVNLIYRLVRDWDAALDLGQDAFLRIFQRASTFRPDGNATSWILAVAVNLARDHLRTRKRRILSFDRVETERPPRASATPPELLEREETRHRVREVLDELPEFPRLILLLRDFEGLSYDALAEFFDCEVGTVKSRLHRARRQFEEVYNQKEKRPGRQNGRTTS